MLSCLSCFDSLVWEIVLIAGDWKADKRHGQGVCMFADGTKFKGAWEEDAWVQSAADGALSRVAGPGLAKALAGQSTSFMIQVSIHRLLLFGT